MTVKKIADAARKVDRSSVKHKGKGRSGKIARLMRPAQARRDIYTTPGKVKVYRGGGMGVAGRQSRRSRGTR